MLRLLHRHRSPWLSYRRARVHTNPPQGPQEALDEDFRPPWVYTTVRLLSYTLIPATAIYAAFFHDFGEHNHVFQPTRAWALQQKAQFFTLSPEEKRLLDRTQQPEEPKSS